ncbi:MAG TPA: hypothetical protein VHV55_05870, partial [Pirellulales bacterium]|nr:hypothetical protein [Pirellulales bacterium]
QAVVTIGGRDIYLGSWNTAASRAEFTASSPSGPGGAARFHRRQAATSPSPSSYCFDQYQQLIVVPGQWKQQWVPHYHQESVHKTFAIEMIRGPVTASSVPPRQAVFGQGPIGAGIFGVVPGNDMGYC